MVKEKTILICSNYAWTICNFRLALIRELKAKGYRIVIVTQYDGHEKKLEGLVDEIVPLFISRQGINPFTDIMTLINLGWIFFRLKPDVVFLFTIKPVIYGSIAAKLFRARVIVTLTGLGTAFIANNWITLLAKNLYKFALSSVAQVFFQNGADKDLFISQRLVCADVCTVIPGSGLDTDYFSHREPHASPDFKFLLIARMLLDKGVGEYVNAARVVKQKYPNCRFQLLGGVDVQNRTAISSDEIRAWVDEGLVEYLGESPDVRPFIEESSCVVLPSYREGTSRVLLEAAAMGRPLIATNVPGCREVVQHAVNGYLCAPKDHTHLSSQMIAMIKLSAEERKAMGIEGRRIVEEQFGIGVVNKIYLASF